MGVQTHLSDKYSDLDLLKRLVDDDESAFSEIYHRYWLQMYRFAYSVLDEQNAAEDIVQDIFLSLWNRRKTIEVDHLKAYLQQAVRFSLSKMLRSRQNDRQLQERLKVATVELISNHPALFKENEELLSMLLNELPDDCREIFRLSREEELTYSEISAQLGVSSATVAKKISQSLAYLRSHLQIELCLLILMAGAR